MKSNKGIRKERGVTLIVLAIAVIILVLIAVFVISTIGRKGEEKDNPVTTEEQEENKEEYVYKMEDRK